MPLLLLVAHPIPQSLQQLLLSPLGPNVVLSEAAPLRQDVGKLLPDHFDRHCDSVLNLDLSLGVELQLIKPLHLGEGSPYGGRITKEFK